MSKRLFSFFLAVALLFAMLPASAIPVSAVEPGIGTKVLDGGKRDFHWPVPGWYGLSGCFMDAREHYAIDIPANEGTKVVAAYDGTVETVVSNQSGATTGFGNYVVVKHNYTLKTGTTVTLYSRYSHLSSTSVSVGDTVVGGQTQVGAVGNTGYSFGNHLDFQICYNGWSPYKTYSIDPYINLLLELPSGIEAASTKDCCGVGPTACCCYEYIEYVKDLYASLDYASSECTPYPCAVKIKVTEDCCPYTQPCNPTTASELGYVSEKLTSKPLGAGDILTASGLYENSEGNYWYKVTLSDGTSAYLYSTHTEKDSLISPWVEGGSFPTSITGATSLQGTVTAGGAQIDAVQAFVYPQGSNTPALQSSRVTVNATTYPLKSSTVDKTLVFGNLANHGAGNYVLKIVADFTTYYAENNQRYTSGLCDKPAASYSFYYGSASVSNVTVTFNANGGSCSTGSKSVVSGGTIGTLPTPSFENMYFEGWYTAPFGGTLITESTVINENVNLYAHYCYNEVKINFDPNGGTLPGAILSADIDGVNNGRPAESLVVFNSNVSSPNTNIYGAEIAVDAWGNIVDTRGYGDETQLTIPAGGFILSGQAGWDSENSCQTGGILFLNSIFAHDIASLFVSLDYETGTVQVFDNYTGYLAAIKRGSEGSKLGALPIPTRQGYLFDGWYAMGSNPVSYHSGFAGSEMVAGWDKEENLTPVASMTYNDHLYEVYDYSVSWTKAKALCESVGGHLVTITDAQEQAAVTALAAEGRHGSYQIGATDQAEANVWTWITGETFSYSNWDPDYPEPGGGADEYYAALIAIENPPNKQVGEWNDVPDVPLGNNFYDISNNGFICEYENTLYTITYSSNGGFGAPSNQTATTGTDLTISSEIPTRFGYSFQGWSTSSTAVSADYWPGDIYTDDTSVTLYAVWQEAEVLSGSTVGQFGERAYINCPNAGVYYAFIPNTSTMYRIVSDSVEDTQVYLYDSSGNLLAWDDDSGDELNFLLTYDFTANETYYIYVRFYSDSLVGIFDFKVSKRYSITYNANGGTSAPETQYHFFDESVTLSTVEPVRSGYTFMGWSVSASAADPDYLPGDICSGNSNLTLYAVWQAENAYIASGWSGDLTWTLTDDCVLTFSGSGKMRNYEYKSEMPWYDYRDQICTVILEEGVTSIGNYAFYGMPNLGFIHIADSVTAIGDYAFKNCPVLDNVYLPGNLTSLGDSAFYACTSLTAIDIPASLWTVKPYTFKNCTALESVSFHEGNLQKISDGAFYNTALTTVSFPDCLGIIDGYSFKNCSKLASITLGSGITQVREAAFYGSAISKITIPEGVTSIKPYAFKNCVNLRSVDLPSTLTIVDEAAFYACTALESLDLPDAVTSIGNYAFRKCESLSSLSLGSGLVTIGECSFYGCESLIYLSVPAKVTTIKPYAFKGCTGLEYVNLPGSLVTLGDSAFHTCPNLSEITIPAKVTTIGAYCFSGSTGIDTFYFLGNAPAIGSGAFNKITATAYYPSGNATWTSAVKQNYGGTITWTAE